jgi:hypothetical protein
MSDNTLPYVCMAHLTPVIRLSIMVELISVTIRPRLILRLQSTSDVEKTVIARHTFASNGTLRPITSYCRLPFVGQQQVILRNSEPLEKVILNIYMLGTPISDRDSVQHRML